MGQFGSLVGVSPSCDQHVTTCILHVVIGALGDNQAGGVSGIA